MTRNERLATWVVFSGTFLLLSAVSLTLADPPPCNSKLKDPYPAYCVDQWTTCEGQQGDCPFNPSCSTGIFGGIQGEYPSQPIKECVDGGESNKYCGFAGQTTCVIKKACYLNANGNCVPDSGDACGFTMTNYVDYLPCTPPPPPQS